MSSSLFFNQDINLIKCVLLLYTSTSNILLFTPLHSLDYLSDQLHGSPTVSICIHTCTFIYKVNYFQGLNIKQLVTNYLNQLPNPSIKVMQLDYFLFHLYYLISKHQNKDTRIETSVSLKSNPLDISCFCNLITSLFCNLNQTVNFLYPNPATCSPLLPKSDYF